MGTPRQLFLLLIGEMATKASLGGQTRHNQSRRKWIPFLNRQGSSQPLHDDSHWNCGEQAGKAAAKKGIDSLRHSALSLLKPASLQLAPRRAITLPGGSQIG